LSNLSIYTQLVDTQESKTPKWDQESLELAFEAILQQREVTTRLCLFLDAFDEHHGDNEELVSLMNRLVSYTDRDRVKIKICIASRPWDTFITTSVNVPDSKSMSTRSMTFWNMLHLLFTRPLLSICEKSHHQTLVRPNSTL
jgi:hypothetical protein